MKARITYCIVFGPGHASDPFDWEVELTEDEAAIYTVAVKAGEDLNAIPELKAALDRAYDEIWDHEAAICEEVGEENALEQDCLLTVHFADSEDL